MEITNQNAAVLLPYIGKLLCECSYFAVDLEFTGIDRDSVGGNSDAPMTVLRSLQRQPSELYPEKLEVLKKYSMLQIGVSIFTEETENTSTIATTRVSTIDSEKMLRIMKAVEEDVRDFLLGSASPSAASSGYYRDVVHEIFQLSAPPGVSATTPVIDLNWLLVNRHVAVEMASIGRQLHDINITASPTGATPSASSFSSTSVGAVELLRRYQFLETLSRSLARRRRDAEAEEASPSARSNGKPSFSVYGATAPPERKRYRVQTFFAYTIPSFSDATQDMTFNIDTLEFLVENNLSLAKWVTDGLRFSPLKTVTASITRDATARLQFMDQLFQPHEHVPKYKDNIKSKLDSLLPFSHGELQLVKFVLGLLDDHTAGVRESLFPYYVGVLRPLILFSRGEVSEATLPDSMYTRDKMYKDEMDALAAIGIAKANRKFVRILGGKASDAGNGNGNTNNNSSGNRNGGSVDGGTVGGSTALSMATRHYGTDLLHTIFYASETYQKPILFFNGYTDLIFLLLSFYGAEEMPSDLAAFKAAVHRHFPVLYDVRTLCCAGPLQEMGNFTAKLSNVVSEMAKVPSIAPYVSFTFDCLLPGGDDPAVTTAAHNAGFDAMLTGKAFAYATQGIAQATVDYRVYKNILSTYSTLSCIYLAEDEDKMVSEKVDGRTPAYYMTNSSGLRVDIIRSTLANVGLTATVMFRFNGYTIQPVGTAAYIAEYQDFAKRELEQRARTIVPLYQIRS